MRLNKTLLVFLLILGFAFGCATPPKNDTVHLWPEFPNEPKYAYLDSYYGGPGFVEISFWDRMFGVPQMQAMNHPNGVFAVGDRIFITATGDGNVTKIEPAKKQVVFYGVGQLKRPVGITGLQDGSRIYVSDAILKAVIEYDAEGKYISTIGRKDELKNPTGLAVDPASRKIYVVDSFGHKVNVYALATGQLVSTIGKPGKGNGEFMFPTNVTVQKETGNIFIVDSQNFRVQVFDQDGKFLRTFGKLGDSWGNFTRPKGIAIDSEANIYVVDAAFNNIQVFNDKNQLLLDLGGAGMGPGQFQLATGIYIDDKDRIFVTDALNSRVQVFQYFSEQWRKEHPEEYAKYLLRSKPAPSDAQSVNK